MISKTNLEKKPPKNLYPPILYVSSIATHFGFPVLKGCDWQLQHSYKYGLAMHKKYHSNILAQDMNLVGTPQILPSRGWQCVAPEVDLREHTLHLPPQCE